MPSKEIKELRVNGIQELRVESITELRVKNTLTEPNRTPH